MVQDGLEPGVHPFASGCGVGVDPSFGAPPSVMETAPEEELLLPPSGISGQDPPELEGTTPPSRSRKPPSQRPMEYEPPPEVLLLNAGCCSSSTDSLVTQAPLAVARYQAPNPITTVATNGRPHALSMRG